VPLLISNSAASRIGRLVDVSGNLSAVTMGVLRVICQSMDAGASRKASMPQRAPFDPGSRTGHPTSRAASARLPDLEGRRRWQLIGDRERTVVPRPLFQPAS